MSCVNEEQRGGELREYLKQVAMGSNKAAADSSYFSRCVARTRDPDPAELTERENTGYGELDRGQQQGSK